MRILALGRTRLLYDAVRAVAQAGHELAAIVTAPAPQEYGVTELDFADLAREMGCAFYNVRHPGQELSDVLSAVGGVDAGITVNWVGLLTQEVLGGFRLGMLNAHLGDLPRFRGNACPNWAILSGEGEVALCVHVVESGRLDCGRIISRARCSIREATTIGEVYAWSDREGPSLFVHALQRLAADPGYQLDYASPDAEEAFRCYPRTPDDSHIDWAKSAVALARLIRASSAPLHGAYTYIVEEGLLRRLYVLDACVVAEHTMDLAEPGRILRNDPQTGCTRVMCGTGVLEITRCRLDDGADFAPGRVFRSIRMKLGVCIADYLWELQQGRGG